MKSTKHTNQNEDNCWAICGYIKLMLDKSWDWQVLTVAFIKIVLVIWPFWDVFWTGDMGEISYQWFSF